MKKIFFVSMLFVFCICGKRAQAQNPANKLAEKIANRMKDSLSLTIELRDSIVSKNMFIHALKMQARQQYTNQDSLRYRVQSIENMRDSIYQTVLPSEKYALFLQKRINLINNN